MLVLVQIGRAYGANGRVVSVVAMMMMMVMVMRMSVMFVAMSVIGGLDFGVYMMFTRFTQIDA